MRSEDAKRHAAMVLRNANNVTGLKQSDLISMSSKMRAYEEEKLLKAGYAHSETGRSVASEYDYGSKRKFVDVLGNVKKEGLANLEKYGDILDNPS